MDSLTTTALAAQAEREGEEEMIRMIRENLTRQTRALELLSALLEEEFAELANRNPQDVSILELSIQELMRQLAAERISLRAQISGTWPGRSRVAEIAGELTDAEAAELTELLHGLDRGEQSCAVQADKNRALALGLYDQSLQLLQELHRRVEPGKADVYSRRGTYAKSTSPQASFFRGRS